VSSPLSVNEGGSTGERARRHRLLILASTFPASPGDGTPGFVADLAAVEAAEFDTLVVVPRVPGAPRRERHAGYEVVRFRYFPRRWEDLADGAILENLRARPSRWLQVPTFLVAEALATYRAVRQHRPDVVHVHWIVPQGVAALVAARGVPWLVTTLGGDLYALRGRPATSLKRRVLRRAAAATAMNEDMRRAMIELGSDPRSTFVLPMGAAVESVRARSASGSRRPGALLFVGRLVEKKGLGYLLEAVRRLPSTLAWTLDVIGDGPLRAELEAQATDCDDRVRFLGQATRRQLFDAYASAAVVVVPSVPAASGDQDGLPVALLEAMAAGCVIVASRLPGIAEAVVDDESGLLVAPGDVEGLAQALEQVLNNGELRERLSQSASERSELFSVAALGLRYRELLTGIVSSRRSAAS
jgi:colanic acid/amylovoran biosynthesis glycosyltransferase